MKPVTRFCVVAIALLLSLSLAQAQEKESPAGCRADAQKFCKGLAPGGGRIARCLKQHQSELSGPCRERIAEARQRAGAFGEACKPDAEKLCKGMQPGQGRVARCLIDHRNQLSAACRGKIEEAEMRHPCMKDAERLCKGVEPGEGRMAACMKQHESELSAECKQRRSKAAGAKK